MIVCGYHLSCGYYTAIFREDQRRRIDLTILSHEQHKIQTMKAIFFVVLGYFGYSVADLCSKYLQQFYSIYQVLGISAGIGCVVTGTWLLTRYGIKAFFPANFKMHALRAFCVLGTAFFMVSALRTLPLADFYGLVFITPFLAMILSIIFLNEKVGWRRWAAACVGFTGVFILAGPQFGTFGEGVIFALLGVVCAASNMICLRKIGSGGPLPLYGFYPFLLMTTFNTTMIFATDNYTPIAAEHIGWYALHGPIVIMGILCLSIGFSKAETSVVAPYQYTQIIWGVTFGWLFFHTMPSETTWIGLVLIIGSGLYSLWREYVRKHPAVIHSPSDAQK